MLLLTGNLGSSQASKWPCHANSAVLRDRDDRNVWLDSVELERLAIHKAAPRIPSSFRVEGTVTVELLIDTDGKVRCGRAIDGHPVLRKPAVDAAERWTFKPFVAEGSPVAIMGRLTIRFSTSRPDQ